MSFKVFGFIYIPFGLSNLSAAKNIFSMFLVNEHSLTKSDKIGSDQEFMESKFHIWPYKSNRKERHTQSDIFVQERHTQVTT